MLYQYSDFIRRFASGKNILIALAVFIAFQVILGFCSHYIKAESQNAGVLDIGFGYSAEEVYTQYLDKFTDKGIQYYKMAECVDLLYPLVYAVLLSLTISWGFSGVISTNNPLKIINLLPLLAADVDYLENIGVFALLFAHPEKWMFMATWTSIFGVLKWIIVGIAMILSLIAIPLGLWKKR